VTLVLWLSSLKLTAAIEGAHRYLYDYGWLSVH
jgi:hypothetical protein